MSRRKQQHYVPKVYLKNFADDSTQQICVYDKSNKKRFRTKIHNVAQERDFYTEKSLEDPEYYEKYYATEVEPKLGKLLGKIRTSAVMVDNDAELITLKERQILSRMIVHQLFRTKSARKYFREKSDQLTPQWIDELLQNKIFDDKPQHKDVIRKYRILSDELLKEIGLPILTESERLERFASLIDTMVCTFYILRDNKQFVTSDNPVVVTGISSGKFGLGTVGLSESDCMIIYPMSPKISAALVQRSSFYALGFEHIENKKILVTEDRVLENINKFQLKQSHRQIYSKDEIRTK